MVNLRGDFEASEVDLAAVVRSLPGKQPLFQTDEGEGFAGPHCDTQGGTGVRVQTGRDVQGQDRSLLAIDHGDGFAMQAAHLAIQAGTEHGIHNHIGLRPALRNKGRNLYPGLEHGFAGAAGITA